MSGKTLETKVAIAGDVDPSIQQAMDRLSDEMERIVKAAAQAADAVDKHSDMLSAQKTVLKAAQKQYASYVLTGEESTEQAQELAEKIKKLSSDLKKNQSALEAAEKAAAAEETCI